MLALKAPLDLLEQFRGDIFREVVQEGATHIHLQATETCQDISRGRVDFLYPKHPVHQDKSLHGVLQDVAQFPLRPLEVVLTFF